MLCHRSTAVTTPAFAATPCLHRHNYSDNSQLQRRRQFFGTLSRRTTLARVSNNHPTYRRSALLSSTRPASTTAKSSSSNTATSAVPALPHPTTPLAPAATLAVTSAPPRYIVRTAEGTELYTVADIRCEAFYGQPKNPHHYPVRRREIYMAMRDRIQTGNKCIVLLDTTPPVAWRPFTTADDELVVASLDVSLHEADGGKRITFTPRAAARGERAMYISSMAVRDDWQRRGLAQRLLCYVDDMAKSYGVKEVYLHVEGDNSVAVHVYRKCGFERVSFGGRSANRWLAFLAKKEHTLMRKGLAG